MKRNDAEQIGKLIQQFLRQESLESPLNEQRLPFRPAKDIRRKRCFVPHGWIMAQKLR